MKEEPKKTESDMIDLADMIDLLEAGDADTEKRRVIGQGIKDFAVSNPPRHHNIGGGMGFGKHIFNTFA